MQVGSPLQSPATLASPEWSYIRPEEEATGPLRTFKEKKNSLTQPEIREILFGLTLRILVSTPTELSRLPTLRAVKLHENLS